MVGVVRFGVVGLGRLCKRGNVYLSCLLFYVLATYNVIAGRVLTCDSLQYSGAPLGDQAAQSHYLDTEPTSPCPILIMPSA